MRALRLTDWELLGGPRFHTAIPSGFSRAQGRAGVSATRTPEWAAKAFLRRFPYPYEVFPLQAPPDWRGTLRFFRLLLSKWKRYNRLQANIAQMGTIVVGDLSYG